MLTQQYRVTMQDGRRVDVVATAPELIRLERKYGTVAALLFSRDQQTEWHVFLAWAALRRRHQGDWPDYDAFIDGLEDVEVLFEGTETRQDAARTLAQAGWAPSLIADALLVKVPTLAAWAGIPYDLAVSDDDPELAERVRDALVGDVVGEAMAAAASPA